jgi:hypothetical protein
MIELHSKIIPSRSGNDIYFVSGWHHQMHDRFLMFMQSGSVRLRLARGVA